MIRRSSPQHAARPGRPGRPARCARVTRARVTAVLALAVPLGAACASTPPPPTDSPTVLRVGLAFPGVASTAFVGRSVVADILAGGRLLLTDRRGRLQSDVASAWRVSPDGHALTLEVRPNARFPDGTRLTADTLQSIVDADRQNPELRALYPLLERIVAVRTQGDDAIVLELDESSSLALTDLSMTITKVTETGARVGVGPFFVESETDEVLTLRANPHYHGGAPEVSAIHLRSYPSPRAAWSAMLRGETDFLYEVPNDAREFLERDSAIQTFRVLRTNVFSLIFNVEREPLREKRVRRALSLAVDRQQIVDLALRGHGRPASGPLWPDHWAAQDDAAPAFRHAPLEAFRALGQPGGAGGVPRLRFTCLVPEGVVPHDRVAMVLQKQLFDVGVDMAIEALRVDELVRRLRAGDFDAALIDPSTGPSLGRTYALWHSSNAGFLRLGYSSADTALDALRTAHAEDDVRLAVAGVRRALTEDPPALFLSWPETTRAVHARFIVPDSDLNMVATVARWRPAAPDGPS